MLLSGSAMERCAGEPADLPGSFGRDVDAAVRGVLLSVQRLMGRYEDIRTRGEEGECMWWHCYELLL